MRLQSYITERGTAITRKTIVKQIKQNCQQYLTEFQTRLKNDRHIYRGTDTSPGMMAKVKTRPNRRPRNTAKDIHKLLNDEGQKRWGFKWRTEGVHTSTDANDAEFYGNIYAFFPVDGYKYVYHPKVYDILSDVSSILSYAGRVDPKHNDYDKRQAERFNKFMDEYQTTDLPKRMGFYKIEVVWKTPQYYLIHNDYIYQIIKDIL